MTARNSLLAAPPQPVATSIRGLGTNLRTARLRRNLTIAEMAHAIGTGERAVADAEKGKASTSIAVYTALLWALGLLDQLEPVAAPERDRKGQDLALPRTRHRARPTAGRSHDA